MPFFKLGFSFAVKLRQQIDSQSTATNISLAGPLLLLLACGDESGSGDAGISSEGRSDPEDTPQTGSGGSSSSGGGVNGPLSGQYRKWHVPIA